MSDRYGLSRRFSGLNSLLGEEILEALSKPEIISFAGGAPDPKLFDTDGLREAALVALQDNLVGSLQYGPTRGIHEFLEELSSLMADDGLFVSPGQIHVLSGSHQGIDLVAKILLDEGDIVFVERPTYFAALQTFKTHRATVVGTETDGHGLIIESFEEKLLQLKNSGRKPKFVYTVPTFSNPTGSDLKRERREKLIELAVEYNFLIIEDDPYSRLRFSGKQMPSITMLSYHQQNSKDRCIYLSSFSKILSPGLRLGWMVVPKFISERVITAKQLADVNTPALNQRIVLNYLKSGKFKKHVERVRPIYQARAEEMVNALRLGSTERLFEFVEPAGGFYIWLKLDERCDARKLLKKTAKDSVIFMPGDLSYADSAPQNYVRLSFSTVAEDAIVRGIRCFKEAVESEIAH